MCRHFFNKLHIQGWVHGACRGSLPLPLLHRHHLGPPPQPQALPLPVPVVLPVSACHCHCHWHPPAAVLRYVVGDDGPGDGNGDALVEAARDDRFWGRLVVIGLPVLDATASATGSASASASVLASEIDKCALARGIASNHLSACDSSKPPSQAWVALEAGCTFESTTGTVQVQVSYCVHTVHL